jgi:hypothetical protein
MTNIIFGKETERITRIIHKEMPALSFIIWDLTPFIPVMHNWRKNIIFIECDPVAVNSLAELVARDYPRYDVYYGIKKPILKITRPEKEASIVIVASEAKHRREVEGIHQKLEKCLVDLLFYAKNEILPLSMKDILDLWEYYLSGYKPMRFNELYRYSLRRYLGWFVSIFAYELSKKIHLKIDERHYRAGFRNAELVKMVA